MSKETEVTWIRRGIGWTDDMSILKYTLVARRILSRANHSAPARVERVTRAREREV